MQAAALFAECALLRHAARGGRHAARRTRARRRLQQVDLSAGRAAGHVQPADPTCVARRPARLDCAAASSRLYGRGSARHRQAVPGIVYEYSTYIISDSNVPQTC